MEDYWASPWADAQDRSPTEAIKNLDVRDGAVDAGRLGGDVPGPRVPGGSLAVHANVPWGGGEHGFGDASAWASTSPVVEPSEIPVVLGGGSRPPEWDEPEQVGVPLFVVDSAADEGRGSLNTIRDTLQQTGAKKLGDWFGDEIHKTSLNLTTTTDEADIWAAGSDWGDTKSEGADGPPLDIGASPEITPENIPLPKFDGVTSPREDKKGRFISTTVLGHRPAENAIKTDANKQSIDSKKNSIGHIPPLPDLGIDLGQKTKLESEPEEKAGTDDKGVTGDESGSEVSEGEEDPDDDFGDFAEGDFEGDFADPQEDLQKETTVPITEVPLTPGLRPDITFDIQTSLVNKLYPIFTTYPEPPPVKEELIYSTNSRKAWYRLSQTNTIRKDKSGDDDYVRVTWHGSRVQEDVSKIVARWMAQDRNSGSGVALGGSRRLGAMFGWGEGVEEKITPVHANQKENAASKDSTGGFGLGGEGVEKSPFGISTTTTPSVESGVTLPPQTASFGWSSSENTQPAAKSSHPDSTSDSTSHSRNPSCTGAVSEDKSPVTPPRTSFYGAPSPPGIPSQQDTPTRSTKSHSPIGSSHSEQSSHIHSLAPTQPSSSQSIQRPSEVTETALPPEARADSLFSSTPAVSRPVKSPAVSKPIDQIPEQAPNPAPVMNFDEWGAFENMATTVKLPNAKEANCDFDEWGALDDSEKTDDPKAADSTPAGLIRPQDQISDLPVKISGTEENVVRSKEDEWSAFEGSETVSRAVSLDKSSARSSLHIPARTDPLSALEDPLTIDTIPSEQPLAHLQKSTKVSRPSAQKTNNWDPLDTFQSSLISKPSVSIPPTNNIPRGSIAKPGTDNWGSFEAFESGLSPQPSIPNQLQRIPPLQASRELNIKPVSRSSLKDHKLNPFDAFEPLQSKAASHFKLPALSTSKGTVIKPPVPTLISPPTAPDDDDDDDWGEMVQSPQIPSKGSTFSSVLLPTSLTPRTMSPALPQFSQATPQQPSSTMSMYDFSSFETKTPNLEHNPKPTNNEGTDTWDLSFFDGPPVADQAPTSIVSSHQGSSDLWDAPVPAVTGRRMNSKEMEEDKVVREIVDGLPDLGYMLQ